MSVYKDLNELAADIFGKSYHVEAEIAEGTKGLGSTQNKFVLTAKDKDNGSLDGKKIFAKENDIQSPVYNLLRVVEKESIMYEKVIPRVLKFLSERDSQLCSDITLLFPNYYGRGIVSTHHYFLFDDLFQSHSEKFMVNASDTFHDEATVHLVMQAIAKFHGVFHSMESVCGVNFKDEYPILAEDYLLDSQCFDVVAPFYNGEFHKTWTMLKVVLDSYSSEFCHPVESKLTLPHNILEIQTALDSLKLLVGDPLTLMKNIKQRENADTSILIHGDFHPLNIAVSESRVKFFDYQLIRHTDGLSDIHQYLCQGTTPEQRSKNLASYLELYYSTLTNTCKRLGMSASPYGNFDNFMLDYQKFSPLQIPYGFGMLTWKYVTDFKAYEELGDSLKKYEHSTALDKAELQENIVMYIDKLGPNVWEAIKILFEFVIEIKRNGMLDQM